ncbi:hypothetical protein EYF80_015666 [Liparis tanakae]|uniref:Uncharacterized protein n=1 Tax=Liparis tanakae TaxID=230148 RepID=A0A4Z2I9E2_9TELE|nr:hypothetical protein EYF80_015666 [Liparis tanakae]
MPSDGPGGPCAPGSGYAGHRSRSSSQKLESESNSLHLFSQLPLITPTSSVPHYLHLVLTPFLPASDHSLHDVHLEDPLRLTTHR